MLVKPGPLIADARGSIAGCTFTRARAGAVVRVRVKARDPSSNAQNLHRAQTSVLFNHWSQLLTNAERLAWNTLGAASTLRNRLGDRYAPTGQQLFFRTNSLALAAGDSIIEAAPPSAIGEMPVLILSPHVGPNHIDLTIGGDSPGNTTETLYWLSGSYPAARYSRPYKYKWFDHQPTPNPYLAITIDDPTGSAFLTDRTTFIRLRILYPNGQLSGPYYDSLAW